jgi:secreted frizzled-related protein 5
VPLLNIKCHSGTQLFLCSLFSPVCLERTIYPCRSLCEKVKQGCEGRMRTYGFPWPDMLKCDKFPLDNDMCISPQSISSASEGKLQQKTYEIRLF